MDDHQWKIPKCMKGELRWKNGWTWHDIFVEVSISTIVLYPKNKRNLVLRTIPLTQISEIKQINKMLNKCFTIFLKNGQSFIFQCTDKSVQKWVETLTHAKKFWESKDILKQRTERPTIKVTSVECNDGCIWMFFTLCNSELFGILVNNTSTFTDVYPRLFGSCQDDACSMCKLRHQSSKLWAVNTSGTKRLVGKDEILAEFSRRGDMMYILEHRQKLLIVHYSDFSYDSLPAAASITAQEVLKLEPVTTKLKDLGCLTPGLFLKIDSGEELLFQNNDQPFKYTHGKFVARSKAIKSKQKSKKEVIAELRRKTYFNYYQRKKTDGYTRDILVSQLEKSSNDNEGLSFKYDHFAWTNDDIKQRSATKPAVIPSQQDNITESRNKSELQRHGAGIGANSQYAQVTSGSGIDTETAKLCPSGSSNQPKTFGTVSCQSSAVGQPNCLRNKTEAPEVIDEHEKKSECEDDNNLIETGKSETSELVDSEKHHSPQLASCAETIRNTPDSLWEITKVVDTINQNRSEQATGAERGVNINETVGCPTEMSNEIHTENQDRSEQAFVSESRVNIIKTVCSPTEMSEEVLQENQDRVNVIKTVCSPTEMSEETLTENQDRSEQALVIESKVDLIETVGCPTEPQLDSGGLHGFIIGESPRESASGLARSFSDSGVRQKTKHKKQHTENSTQSLTGMFRSVSAPILWYAFPSDSLMTPLATSVPELNTSSDQCLRVNDVFTPIESSCDHDDDVFTCPHQLTSGHMGSSGPGWQVARKVEKAVNQILAAGTGSQEVNDLIANSLCPSLFEIFENGLKKSASFFSRLFKNVDVWDICKIISLNAGVAKSLISEIDRNYPAKGFLYFVRACIRKNHLSSWFELLREVEVQRKIAQFYEEDALVLQMADLASMEHMKVFLDRLDGLKLMDEKPRRNTHHGDDLFIFE